jgi:DNA-binding MarR family transcriptional regulator
VKNTPPIPLTSQSLLRLHLSQIKALIALDSLGNETLHSASEVAKFLGVKRAMVSKALNELHRIGIIKKSRNHRIVVFRVAEPQT